MPYDEPAPADLIFVFAGRMDRKPYGMELYRAGLAPVLILSVGRFEVSKMDRAGLDLAVARNLVALRDATPPDERHFFVRFDPGCSKGPAIAAEALLNLRETGAASADEGNPAAPLLKKVRRRLEPALLIIRRDRRSDLALR